jgi:D-alanyl-D-alanine carboxypeptidase
MRSGRSPVRLRDRLPAWAAVPVLVTLVTACSPAGSGTTGASPHRQLVRAISSDLRAHPDIPGEAVSVRAPGLEVEAARGFADVATRTPLRVDTPFRVASVTKTFVAAAVLRLVEQGTVALDAPISRYLSGATLTELDRGGYEPGQITVRELLDHTSGLFDYASSTAYDDLNVEQPGRHWTREEQLAFAMDHGHRLGEPGRVYHYADTNYILVGEILERATGRPLAAAVRTLLGFGRLGLDHTYWETLEAPPAGETGRAHQYYDTTFDNITLDASSDLYGGGGLVSTVGDLTRFYRALFDGRVFGHDKTLDAMLTESKPGHRAGAALGIFATEIAGTRCWGHPGYWGTEAYYCPGPGLAFALETNQANEADLDTTSVEKTVVGLGRAAHR